MARSAISASIAQSWNGHFSLRRYGVNQYFFITDY
jgi:hypothetical protein